MKLCRFNQNRLGVVEGEDVLDVTEQFDTRPAWPQPPADWIVSQLPSVLPRLRDALPKAKRLALASVRLESPVANPGKIVGAPINYHAHVEEARADPQVSAGRTITTLEDYGLFIKASSALIGCSDEVRLRIPERRNDHEVELAVIMGRKASRVRYAEALEYVAGYCIGLDMTIRGKEFPTFRKSADTYCVLGPWMVTADEIPDPDDLKLSIKVNGEMRQNSSTKHMILDVRRLIEYASEFYSFLPGDVIMTGTPEGVSQVSAGDVMDCYVEKIGEMRVKIAGG